jgi:hypothetical protein
MDNFKLKMTAEIDKTAKKLAGLQQKSHERNELKEIMLPVWPNNKRGTPNSFLRSALFPAIKSTAIRERLVLEFVESQSGISIKYDGYVLNQEDLTLWETLVHLCRKSPLGDICEFTGYEILKALNLGDGADDYKRLYEGITRLAVCHLNINAGQYFGAMILQGTRDKETQRYVLQLNRQLINLYKQHTWIDWDERLVFRKSQLAQYLHGFYSSHTKPYPIKIETLHKLSGSRIKSLAKFKQNLKVALDELKKTNFLEEHKFDGELVIVYKK